MFSIVVVVVVVVGKAENQKTRLWSLLPEAPMLTEMHVHAMKHMIQLYLGSEFTFNKYYCFQELGGP